LRTALDDGVISEDERDDLIWVCERLCTNEFYDEITTGLQELHGLLGGVVADGIIAETELRGIQDWMEANEQSRKRWPYDEVESLIISVIADGKIDEEEHKALVSFFAQFVEVLDDKTLSDPVILSDSTLKGVCANSPEIIFDGARFCLTGASSRYTRDVFADKIRSLGGEVVGSVSGRLNYLVIGGDGNPCWSYACYGRKVEKAIELRKTGAEIIIVHEFDLHDAIEDEC
jgi:NAD-dependent DNA ligase